MMKTKINFLKEYSFGKRVFLTFFFTLFFILASAQTVGDFRSVASGGNWTALGTWERCTSIAPAVWSTTTAYPGSPTGSGNYAVTVSTGTTVIVDVLTSVLIGNLYVEGTLELKADFTLTGGAKTIGITNGLILLGKKVEFRLPQSTVFSMDIEDSIMQGLHGFTPPGKEDCDANTAVMIWNGSKYERYTTCTGQPGTTGMNFAGFNNTNANLNVTASNGFSKAFCAFNIADPIVFSGDLTGAVSGSTINYEWQYYPPGSNNLSPLPAGVTAPPNTNTLTIAQNANLTGEGVYTFRLIFKYITTKITLIRYADFYVYIGASSVWDGNNWSYGAPSDLYPLKAVIDKDYSTGVKGSFSACSCTINSNTILTASANTYVKVRDNIINNGSVVVESDGNLIQQSATGTYSGTGTFKAKRNIKDLRYLPGTSVDYVFWSSPVIGQNLQTFSPGTPANLIQQYNEATDYFTPANGNFAGGKGYAIRAEGPTPGTYSKPYEFTGAPNNGNIPVTINRSANTGATGNIIHGYNLLGNPYPSNINFDELFNSLPIGLIEPKVWFWTNITYTAQQGGSSYDGSNYVVYTKGGSNSSTVIGIIKVGQAFIVQKTNFGLGTLTFRNMNGAQPIRVDTSGHDFWQKSSDKNRFWLELISPDNNVNSQLIGYFTNATDGYDSDYDAEAMSLTSDLFYSVSDDKRLIVQGKDAQFKMEDRVQLGANFFQKGNYTIALQQPEGIFGNGQNIYLKDNQTGTLTNLTGSNYNFEAKAGENNARFEIIYRPGTILITESKVKESIVVYRDSDNFVVQAPKIIASVEVYDLSGKLITIVKAINRKAVLNSSFFNKGIYVLRIKIADGTIINKKIMK